MLIYNRQIAQNISTILQFTKDVHALSRATLLPTRKSSVSFIPTNSKCFSYKPQFSNPTIS